MAPVTVEIFVFKLDAREQLTTDGTLTILWDTDW
jgi:hypothetical protein